MCTRNLRKAGLAQKYDGIGGGQKLGEFEAAHSPQPRLWCDGITSMLMLNDICKALLGTF